MKKIRVEKDGRLRLPKQVVSRAGLSAGELVDEQDVELRRRRMERRAFLRWLPRASVAGAILAFLAHVGNIEDLAGLFTRLRKAVDPDIDPKLLARLFGIAPTLSAALIPSANHPFSPPPAGRRWYPIEEECAVAYTQRFSPDVALRKVSGCPRLQPEDSAILFGSQVSNLLTRIF